MENACFEFVEKITETETREIMFSYDDIIAIEKRHVLLNPDTTEYVLAFYTRSRILLKESNCLVVHFNSREERDNAYSEIRAKNNPTRFEAKWYPI
jgi:hypothetical protein